MAAPPEKTTQDLNGKWFMNKQLSDSPEPVLALQGIGYLTRKGISLASITIEMKQYTALPLPPSTSTELVAHVNTSQSASGLNGTHEARCLDNTFRAHSDWIFGNVKGLTRWVSLDEIEDDFLKQGWLVEGDGKTLIFNYVESDNNGWNATQVWGFQVIEGERRYCRRVLAKKGGKTATVLFVYDFIS
ncbi:hypothetical protein AK830_g5996 [Neonectria ditissima]|uniref:Lipocalin-like domain-containing protein n=1 Tax=Neonectria ditissima TaxID=78410 RepID=A0A0P7B3C8_9HYPO|nr:hypothetical protein AK830_g5996 [Neonectria ditissima]